MLRTASLCTQTRTPTHQLSTHSTNKKKCTLPGSAERIVIYNTCSKGSQPLTLLVLLQKASPTQNPRTVSIPKNMDGCSSKGMSLLRISTSTQADILFVTSTSREISRTRRSPSKQRNNTHSIHWNFHQVSHTQRRKKNYKHFAHFASPAPAQTRPPLAIQQRGQMTKARNK